MTRYVIVGNSAGGIGAAEAIRQADAEGQITLISDEQFPAYSRPLISEYVAGEKSLPEMLYRKQGFYEAKRIEALLGERVERIDAGGWLQLHSGKKVDWDRIVLATGGRPIFPAMPGRDMEGVFTFTTLGDAQALRSAIASARTAVVIGGGLIGLSVAEALRKRDLTVHLVELRDRVLSLVLDEIGSRMVENRLRQVGIHVITGTSVDAILGRAGNTSRVGGVALKSGEELACDLVVVAIGVTPRTDLAAEAGISVNRGIVVNRQMATSLPGVYACGDAAEAYDFVLGTSRVMAIWPNAYMGGRIAGANAAGQEQLYAGNTTMNSLKYFGLSVASAGETTADGNPDMHFISGGIERGRYRKVILHGGRVVGFVMAGTVESSGIILGLMRDSVPVQGYESALVEDGFSLMKLPAELRKRRLSELPRAQSAMSLVK